VVLLIKEEEMHLTREENEMLDGKYGYPVQKSMEVMVALGECYGAEKMIPVASGHSIAQLTALCEAGVQFIEELANKGGKFVIFVDTNPIGIDPDTPKDFGLSDEFVQRQMAATTALAKMGAFLSNTCAPYLIGHFPRWRQHVAWNESSAVNFVNSVLGARTNREGGPSALAAGLIGRTAEYGYHLDRNRYGDLKIRVTAKLKGPHDYGALGHYTGKVAGNKIPVFVGIPTSVSSDDFKMLGASAAGAGAVELYHVVGITPEAPTEAIAFGRKRVRDWQTVEFGERELREAKESLSLARTREVDVVAFGCPHASITEIREVARLISGKRVKAGVELLITTSRMTAAYARMTGDLDAIERGGGRVMCDTCAIIKCQELLRNRNPGIMATNAAKMANVFCSRQDIIPHYGSLEECVEAAITGKWGVIARA
jgi:predicted aconitase